MKGTQGSEVCTVEGRIGTVEHLQCVREKGREKEGGTLRVGR